MSDFMCKFEFLIRFSMIKGKKTAQFRKFSQYFPNGLPNQLSIRENLSKLNLDEQQKTEFKQIDKNKITKYLHWLEQENHQLISYDNPNYPQLLKQIHSAPIILWIKGNTSLLSSPQIAIIGSRYCSDYGIHWGRYFSSELAINGLTITSGLALGIDAISHRGALDVSGKTLAVLGSGLNHISPRTNSYLAQDILSQNGAIISEFQPDEKARPEYFPRRNRIISGLSLGTFIIEASEKSGSLITARYALEQNRDVFALPGEIDNINSRGTHWLIKQGAYLVTKPTDILEHFHHYLIKKPINSQKQDNDVTIHPEIFAIIQNKPIAVDIIADQVQQSVIDVSVKLLDLELIGAIKNISGGYIRNPK